MKSMVAEKFNDLEKVAIVESNFGHMFELGTIVTLRKMYGYYSAECDNGEEWFVSDCELKSLVIKNIIGTENDLVLYGSSGEVRYSYTKVGNVIKEVHYNEAGASTKYKEHKIY